MAIFYFNLSLLQQAILRATLTRQNHVKEGKFETKSYTNPSDQHGILFIPLLFPSITGYIMPSSVTFIDCNDNIYKFIRM